MTIFLNFMEKFFNSILHIPLFYYLKKIFAKKLYSPTQKHVQENYINLQPSSYVLIDEVKRCIDIVSTYNDQVSVIDLCCGPGRHLNEIYEYKNTKLYGVEINSNAKDLMHKNFPDLANDSVLIIDDLRNFFKYNNEKFDVVFTHGRSIDLIPPTIDLVKEIANITKHFFIMINIKNDRPSHQRFWEYEFKKHGLTLIKHFYPESSYCIPESDDRDFMFQVYRRNNKLMG